MDVQYDKYRFTASNAFVDTTLTETKSKIKCMLSDWQTQKTMSIRCGFKCEDFLPPQTEPDPDACTEGDYGYGMTCPKKPFGAKDFAMATAPPNPWDASGAVARGRGFPTLGTMACSAAGMRFAGPARPRRTFSSHAPGAYPQARMATGANKSQILPLHPPALENFSSKNGDRRARPGNPLLAPPGAYPPARVAPGAHGPESLFLRRQGVRGGCILGPARTGHNFFAFLRPWSVCSSESGALRGQVGDGLLIAPLGRFSRIAGGERGR